MIASTTEIIPATEAELVKLAASTYASILRSSREVIRYKFELGRLVSIHLQWHAFQHDAMARLAQALSNLCGKSILPQRLYEAARFYDMFGGQIERVWALERRLTQPLTYTYIIRGIIPHVSKDKAWNVKEWEYYQEAQLSRLEHAVREIEELGARPPKTADTSGSTVSSFETAKDSVLDQEAEGFLTACRDSRSYQQFSIGVLIDTIVRAVDQLERKADMLTTADRQSLQNIVPRLTKLIGHDPVEVAA